MLKIIPLYYYQAQIVLVDDDQELTQGLSLKLHSRMIKTFNQPKEALKYMRATDREEVSILIADYHMPEITGLELLEELQNYRGKRILITAEPDYKIGIDAFNKELIHAYISKNDANFAEKLDVLIKEMEWQYFAEKTSPQISKLGEDKKFFLDESCFLLFLKLLKEQDIISFDWLEKPNCFVLHTKNGEKKYLLIRSKTESQNMAVVAEEDGAPQNLIKKIQQEEVFPFLGEDTEFWQVKASEWENHLLKKVASHGEWVFFN